MTRTRRIAHALGIVVALATVVDLDPALAQGNRTKTNRRATPDPDAEAGMPNGPMPGDLDPMDRGDRGDRGRRGASPRDDTSPDRLRDLLVRQQANPYPTLLPIPLVQKDLKLTDKQKANIRTRIEAYAANSQLVKRETRNARQNGEISEEEEAQTSLEFRQEYESELAGLLKADQRRRLHQISLQIQGPLALADRDLATKLNIADEDYDQIREIVMNHFNARDQDREIRRNMDRNPRNSDPDDPTSTELRGARTRTNARQDENSTTEALTAIGKLLKPKQKAAFNKMLGSDPFDVQSLEAGGQAGSGRGNRPPTTVKSKEASSKKQLAETQADPSMDPEDGNKGTKAKGTTKGADDTGDDDGEADPAPKPRPRPSRKPSRPTTSTVP